MYEISLIFVPIKDYLKFVFEQKFKNMNKKYLVALLAAGVFLTVSCKGHSQKNETVSTPQTQQPVPSPDKKKKFEYVRMPDSLTTQQQRIEFITEHFWDNYDFADTTLLSIPDVSEQGFADFVHIISQLDSAHANRSVRIFLERAAVDSASRDHFFALTEKYLYDPNSPFRNEELYQTAIDVYTSLPQVPEHLKIRPKTQLKNILKNQVGSRAANIRYETAEGRSGSLNAIKTPYVLVYFNNPGCEHCHQTTEHMRRSLALEKALNERRITVLSVYPDEDLTLWREHVKDFPETWIVGYDKPQDINEKQTYDLRAIPSLYLLDKNKNVLLKDATYDAVENYLQNLK